MTNLERIHTQFRQALAGCLLNDPQDPARLAVAAGLELTQLWEVADGRRTIGLEAQAALAQAAGHDYDRFLALGRGGQSAPAAVSPAPADQESVAGYLSRLLRMAGTFGAAASEDELVGRITEALCRYLPFQRAMLFVFQGGTLKLRSLGWPQAPSPEQAQALRQALELEPPRLSPLTPEYESFSLGRALPLELEGSEFFAPSALKLLAPAREVALAPLFTDREFIGVVEADYAQEVKERLSEEDLTLLETFAAFTGSMLNNWWLYSELEEKRRQLEFKVRELTLVGEMTRVFNRALGPEAMAQQMLAVLSRAVEAAQGFLFLYDQAAQELNLFAAHGVDQQTAQAWSRLSGVTPAMLGAASAGSGLPAEARGRMRRQLLPGLEGPALIRVLWAGDKVMGLWGLGRPAGAEPFSPQDRQLLAVADEQVSVALTSLRLRRMATTDQLTGLYTRAHFDQALEQELKLARYLGLPLSLVMLDADHFKLVNDTHGHPGGDAVLAALGRVLRESLRSGDLAARIGGEEFALLLPRSDAAQAQGLAEKVRQAVAGLAIPYREHALGITVSLGLTSQDPAQPLGADEMMLRADHALYRAKGEGRNRVCLWSQDMSS